MEQTSTVEEEQRVLRWGGMAGMLGSIVLVVVFAIVIVFVGADPAEPEGLVSRFPDIKTARVVENGLYLLVLVLWIPHYLALYRALRSSSLAPALFGSVLGILGLVVLAAGALVHIATEPISDLYHAPGVRPDEQATLVLIWQATQGIFDALLVTGLLIVPIGLIALGYAMFASRDFGRWPGSVGVGLGLAGLVAAATQLVDVSLIAAVTVLSFIVFHAVTGWRLYRLARVPRIVADNAPRITPGGRTEVRAT